MMIPRTISPLLGQRDLKPPMHRCERSDLGYFAGGPDKERVALLPDKVSARQFVDARAIDGGVEGELGVVQRAELAKVGRFVVPCDGALLTHVDFLLENDSRNCV